MQIKKEKPEIYDVLHEIFGVDWEHGIAISYGDTVYCKNDLKADVKVHEQVHLDQQNSPGMSPKLWWIRYIAEPDFRMSQEVEAYREQASFIKGATMLTRHMRRYLIGKLAADLSGGMYGFKFDYKKALDMLK